jgi:hypothetical protein
MWMSFQNHYTVTIFAIWAMIVWIVTKRLLFWIPEPIRYGLKDIKMIIPTLAYNTTMQLIFALLFSSEYNSSLGCKLQWKCNLNNGTKSLLFECFIPFGQFWVYSWQIRKSRRAQCRTVCIFATDVLFVADHHSPKSSYIVQPPRPMLPAGPVIHETWTPFCLLPDLSSSSLT